MNIKIKYIFIAGFSIMVLTGIAYSVNKKNKIDNANNKTSTFREAIDAIGAIDTSDIQIPADASTEPTIPLYSNDGSDDIISHAEKKVDSMLPKAK